jgi:hypothetical protein
MPLGKTPSRIGFSELITPWRLAKRKIPERNALMWANVVDVSLCSFAIASKEFFIVNRPEITQHYLAAWL